MQERTITCLPHYRGEWSSSYVQSNGTLGYEYMAEVYGPERDSLGNYVSTYRSLIDNNTNSLTDRTAWLLYSNISTINDYIEEVVRLHTSDFLKEVVNISIEFRGGEVLSTGINVVVKDENNEIIWDDEIGNETVTIQLVPRLRYTITATTRVSGFSTPQPKMFTALSGNTRNINFIYKHYDSGIFLQNTSGENIIPSEWNSSMTLNGIYVSDGERAVLISPKNLTTGTVIWADHAMAGVQVPGIPIATNTTNDVAKNELSFESEQAAINFMQYNGNVLPAFSAILDAAEYGYVFPDGETRGYLGTVYMWKLILLNWNKINEAVTYAATLCLQLNQSYWCSTQNSATEAWRCYSGGVTNNAKYFGNYVRPVAAL